MAMFSLKESLRQLPHLLERENLKELPHIFGGLALLGAASAGEAVTRRLKSDPSLAGRQALDNLVQFPPQHPHDSHKEAA